MVNSLIQGLSSDNTAEESLFSRIAADLSSQGYSIQPTALPEALASGLWQHQQTMNDELYSTAGIGRGEAYLKNKFVRTNKICWITGESKAGEQWLDWTGKLQTFLNRNIFLGLFSFESHFAHYRPGDYYKRHYDAFRGEANRVLSIVVYLNPGWIPSEGGELVLYKNDDDRDGTRVVPLLGTVVTFFSEEFPHEVLPATRDRYSIAGWFRLNTTSIERVDPPS